MLWGLKKNRASVFVGDANALVPSLHKLSSVRIGVEGAVVIGAEAAGCVARYDLFCDRIARFFWNWAHLPLERDKRGAAFNSHNLRYPRRDDLSQLLERFALKRDKPRLT